jgi:integrase
LGTYAGRTSKGVRETTIADYRRNLEADAIPILGRKRLGAITAKDIRDLLTRVESRGVSTNTVRLALAPVRALFATALEEGLIERNPTAGVRIRRSQATEADDANAKALTRDELLAVLARIPERHRLFFSFLARTGLRVSEALAVRWQDVEDERVYVRRRFYKGTFAQPKSTHGRRTVPIPPALVLELTHHRVTSDYGAQEDLVFTNRRGEPLDSAYLAKSVLKPAALAAGVPWASFHTFRHTCLTELLRSGLSPKEVQVWAGHHSAAFTLSVYVHLLPEDLPVRDVLSFPTPLAGTSAGAAKING